MGQNFLPFHYLFRYMCGLHRLRLGLSYVCSDGFDFPEQYVRSREEGFSGLMGLQLFLIVTHELL
jgi:hypothetical protein